MLVMELSKHIEAIKEYGPVEIHRMSFLTNIILIASNYIII